MDVQHLPWMCVGQKISTKAVGSATREDVTSNYKYPEGTIAERAALKVGEEAKTEDVTLAVEFSRRASIGEDFVIVVKASTSAADKRVVRVRASVHTVTYTGVASKVVGKYSNTIELEKGVYVASYPGFPHTCDREMWKACVRG